MGPGAVILGDVTFGKDCSVFSNASIRGDSAKIVLGDRVNVQENCVLHVNEGFPLTLGNDITVGHGSIVHGCTVGDNTLIGMGSIIMNGARVGRDSIVAAGSVVTQGKEFPDGVLIMGSPGKAIRALKPEEIESNRRSAEDYVGEAERMTKLPRITGGEQ
ncbi:MAG: gamma carbonic anhydrase family protein [Lachnospiraceae bacterium]|nr:gamma carbonic anhydrase family protein [Lachnospiraceae bacterium]